MLDRDITPQYVPNSEFLSTIPRWQRCATLMSEYFRLPENRVLLLDMDGVVYQADSLHTPQFTTSDIIPTLSQLEVLGVKLGVATSRSFHVVNHLRENGIALQGPLILEEGQTVSQNGITEHLTLPQHKAFIQAMNKAFLIHPSYRETWEEVCELAQKDQFDIFCPGNSQWQGENRTSVWIYQRDNEKKYHKAIREIFDPVIQTAAENQGLDFNMDISRSIHEMTVGSLTIVSIKGKLNGQPIHKGMAAKQYLKGGIFVADGFGDNEIAEVVVNLGGKVIGIRGNKDKSDDAPKFLRDANMVLDDPDEFVLTLKHLAILLAKN